MVINFSNIGGGGGGSYTLPIASDTVLGGVKVGSGLTIDASTGVLSAEVPEVENNYVIVDSLDEITAPYEGLVAYKRETQELLTWSGFTFDASAIQQGYAIHIDRNGRNIAEVYRSGSNFYWSWTTDGEVHKFSSGDVTCFYQASTDGTFKIAFEDLSDITYRLETGVEYVGETTLSFTEVYKQEEYIHTGTEWVNINQYVDFSTNDWNGTKCANFRNWLFSMPEPIRNSIKWSGKAPNGLYEGLLELIGITSDHIRFKAINYDRNSNEGINPITGIVINIANSINVQYNNQFPDIEAVIDSNHNLSLSGTKNDKYSWLNIDRIFWGNEYAHFILKYNNFFLPAYKANIDNTSCIVLDEVREGIRYKGKWKTGDGTVISWSEEPVEKTNYIVVDDLSGITTPYEGLKAFVRTQYEEKTKDGLEFSYADATSDNGAIMVRAGATHGISFLHLTDTYPGFQTDGGTIEHMVDGINVQYNGGIDDKEIAIYLDSTNKTMKICDRRWNTAPFDYYFTGALEGTTATATTVTYTIPSEYSREYTYIDEYGWLEKDACLNFDNPTEAEKALNVKYYNIMDKKPWMVSNFWVKVGGGILRMRIVRVFEGCISGFVITGSNQFGMYYLYITGDGRMGGIQYTSSIATLNDIKTYSAGTGITINNNNVISTSGVVQSTNVTNMVKLTQAVYEALETKDPNTLYVIVEEE